MPKTWREKLQGHAHLPQVKAMPDALIARLGEGTIGLPSPRMVLKLMKSVPKGRLITMAELSDAVGCDFGMDASVAVFQCTSARVSAQLPNGF
jgi:hypothetical protein